MRVGTHEPLFLVEPNPNDLFTKEAGIARMPEDERKWPAQVYSNIHQQLPFLSSFDVDIAFTKTDPEAGYGVGYAALRNKTASVVALEELGKPTNRIRIPVIVSDRQLEPFHTFELGGGIYPLTQDRVESALMNPELFDCATSNTPRSPSLVDQLYPPFQQRKGFGRMSSETAGGLGKISSAPGSKEAANPGAAKRVARELMEAKLKSLGRRKDSEKKASLCEEIAGTLNETDFARFNDVFKDQTVRRLIEKNATVMGALGRLTSQPIVSSQKLAEAAVAKLNEQRFDVVQIRPEGYGYRVKWATAPGGMAPEELSMTAEQAKQTMPPQMLAAADQQGIATVTNVRAEPDPLIEQPEPVTKFGIYKVWESGTGKQMIGYVLPELLDPVAGGPSSMQLFLNGGQFAIQPGITGVMVGMSHNLPASDRMRGMGLFYKTDGRKLTATVPYNIMTEVTLSGRRFYSATGQDGMPVQITISDGMKQPYAMAGDLGGPMEIFIPTDWNFLALDNQVQIEGGQNDPMMTVQASAYPTMIEVRAWKDGCSLGGPVLQKIGSGTYDWADGLFWMAAVGIPQDMGVQILDAAAHSHEAVRIYGVQALEPLSAKVASAVKMASASLLELAPHMPKRICLLKEAAAIFTKESSSFVDASSADSVLALNFVNPENLSSFVEHMPQLEEASTKLAALVLATQLGMQSISKTAAVRAMFALEDVLRGLKTLQTYSV